jgi:hypothetical protein
MVVSLFFARKNPNPEKSTTDNIRVGIRNLLLIDLKENRVLMFITFLQDK